MIKQIKDLFYVNYGQKEYENKQSLESGKNLLISSKGDENGVYGFFNIKNYYKAPFITVPRTGTIGQAFVQTIDCSVDNNCLVLIPKEDLSFEELNQIAVQIRFNKWRYKYGRQITPTRIGEQEVIVSKTEKNWINFEDEITPIDSKKSKIIENKKLQWKKIKELCSINRQYYFYMNQINIDTEKTPYITTTEKNNGISIFCGEEPINKKNQLTIALDGKCGEAFYQITDFISGEKTAILDHKNKFFLIYIGVCIKLLSWKFHYGRKLSMTRLSDMEIPIPYKDDKIDFEYIEKIVRNAYGFNEIKEYF